MTAFSWEARLKRAEELEHRTPAGAEVLSFYKAIAKFQRGISDAFASSGETSIEPLFEFIPELTRLVARSAPTQMRDAAQQFRKADWEPKIREQWSNPADPQSLAEFEFFFVRALLQPYAEFVMQRGAPAGAHAPIACPFCSALPCVAVLRGEGEGAKRFLLCSLCATEWEFRRVKCPGCGEEDKDNLPVFVEEDPACVRIEACDTCRGYLKAVDLTKNGHAVPIVDEIATVWLNVFAEENGYRKIQPNLLCM